MLRIGLTGAIAALLASASPAHCAGPELSATMTLTSAVQIAKPVGKITVKAGPDGAVFRFNLRDLPTGPHGFHVHEGGSCADAPNAKGEMTPAGAAGPHWDPQKSGKHEGPEGHGHMADLPRIEAREDGRAKGELRAPRITDLNALKGHAVIIHAGGDTYSDTPEPLGGGGARIACGVLN